MVTNRKAYRTALPDLDRKGDFCPEILGQRLNERFHHSDSFYQTGMKKQFVWTTSLGCIALLAAETIFLPTRTLSLRKYWRSRKTNVPVRPQL